VSSHDSDATVVPYSAESTGSSELCFLHFQLMSMSMSNHTFFIAQRHNNNSLLLCVRWIHRKQLRFQQASETVTAQSRRLSVQ